MPQVDEKPLGKRRVQRIRESNATLAPGKTRGSRIRERFSRGGIEETVDFSGLLSHLPQGGQARIQKNIIWC
jgi:hypothetical protein